MLCQVCGCAAAVPHAPLLAYGTLRLIGWSDNSWLTLRHHRQQQPPQQQHMPLQQQLLPAAPAADVHAVACSTVCRAGWSHHPAARVRDRGTRHGGCSTPFTHPHATQCSLTLTHKNPSSRHILHGTAKQEVNMCLHLPAGKHLRHTQSQRQPSCLMLLM